MPGSHHTQAVQLSGGNKDGIKDASAPSVRKRSEQKHNKSNTRDLDSVNAYIDQGHNQINEPSTPVSKALSKKQKIRLKRKPLSIVFNKSSFVLTQDMEEVLNRGLNFAVLSNRLDLTQVLTDFRYFERTMIWMEFWHGRDQEGQLYTRIFKKKKN